MPYFLGICDLIIFFVGGSKWKAGTCVPPLDPVKFKAKNWPNNKFWPKFKGREILDPSMLIASEIDRWKIITFSERNYYTILIQVDWNDGFRACALIEALKGSGTIPGFPNINRNNWAYACEMGTYSFNVSRAKRKKYVNCGYSFNTRIHSSRRRTDRQLTVRGWELSGCVCPGGCAVSRGMCQGVCVQGGVGGWCIQGSGIHPPFVDRMTDACENILRMRSVIINPARL